MCVLECVEQSQGHSLGFTLPLDILCLPAVLLSFGHTVQFRANASRTTPTFVESKRVFRRSLGGEPYL